MCDSGLNWLNTGSR